MFNQSYAWIRLWAIMAKEFIQIKRDRATFAMIIGIPLIQVILFGYAINNDPKYLPTAVISADQSNFTRSFLRGLENTGYFKITQPAVSERAAQAMLARSQVQFVVNIPPDFSKQLVHGEKPSILITADATDPATTGNALGAANVLAQTVFRFDLVGPLAQLNNTAPPVTVITHAEYNPAGITQYNIVPALMGVVLTMTMVMITAVAITREYERGTMENLLATPARPAEVIIGKVMPYIIVGYIQAGIILIAASLLFHVPVKGSLILLLLATFPFIVANLAVGLSFSTIARNQLQASQMTIFFFLPSLLLSGFMFPFRGMPAWAQFIGDLLPLTHFLKIVRGILLKGNGWAEVWFDLWPILVFMVLALVIGIKRYRQTLD